METAVEIERIIEQHNNEKIILKFLICSNHFNEIVCKENCKSNFFCMR